MTFIFDSSFGDIKISLYTSAVGQTSRLLDRITIFEIWLGSDLAFGQLDHREKRDTRTDPVRRAHQQRLQAFPVDH